uniref:ATP synthase subunit f n=1 Tax=Tetranychus cinnabarinus TaxID=93129 RepID=A0A059UDX2_TETCI|nr:ATP synthase subunit f [Tetranychus cinnabarinus]
MAESSKNPVVTWWRTFNCYPPEYNRAIHGPYDPRINYACKDKGILDVKLNELPSWLMRRRFTPSAMAGVMSRHFYRSCHHHFIAVRSRSNMFFTVLLITAAMGYVFQLHTMSHHRRYKYHW